MSFGLKLTTVTAALVLAGSAFANKEACPSLSDLQAVGITMSSVLVDNLYVGYSIDNYNTSSIWGFAIGPVEADSDGEAIAATNEILANMSAPGIPDPGNDNDLVCFYDTGMPDIFAVAVKNLAVSPMKFKQYLHKAH